MAPEDRDVLLEQSKDAQLAFAMKVERGRSASQN
jgi:hypothetical protein